MADTKYGLWLGACWYSCPDSGLKENFAENNPSAAAAGFTQLDFISYNDTNILASTDLAKLGKAAQVRESRGHRKPAIKAIGRNFDVATPAHATIDQAALARAIFNTDERVREDIAKHGVEF